MCIFLVEPWKGDRQWVHFTRGNGDFPTWQRSCSAIIKNITLLEWGRLARARGIWLEREGVWLEREEGWLELEGFWLEREGVWLEREEGWLEREGFWLEREGKISGKELKHRPAGSLGSWMMMIPTIVVASKGHTPEPRFLFSWF